MTWEQTTEWEGDETRLRQALTPGPVVQPDADCTARAVAALVAMMADGTEALGNVLDHDAELLVLCGRFPILRRLLVLAGGTLRFAADSGVPVLEVLQRASLREAVDGDD